MIVVADASAVGAFMLADEAGPYADFARMVCRSNIVHVPSVWPTEVGSLIKNAYRRARINDIERDKALVVAEALRNAFRIEPDQPIHTVVEYALRAELSAYDATYALLAQRLQASLLTADGPLRRAADRLGLGVLTP